MLKNKIVSGSGYTGNAHAPSAEEIAAANKEASESKRPANQTQADEFFKAKANEGIENSPVPEAIFHGASVDPEDLAGGAPRKFIGRAGMRERFGTDMAIGRIDDRLAKELGINLATEEPTYMLCDNYGGNGANYEQEWLFNNPDGRIPTFQSGKNEGEPYRMQGMVLGVVPREVMKEIRDELDAEIAAKEYQLAHGNPDLPSDERELQRMRAESTQAINEMIKGSNTQRMDVADALAMRSKEKVDEDVDKYRWLYSPKPSERGATVETQKNQVDRVLETAKADAKGSRSFAMPGFRDNKK